nr:DUF4259 domain-containing protein [Lysobacter enzymogenes]
MGAWGVGTFENDDALDWLGDLTDTDDSAAVRALLAQALASDCLDAPDATTALAAAETVLSMLDAATPALAWHENSPPGCRGTPPWPTRAWARPPSPRSIASWAKNRNCASCGRNRRRRRLARRRRRVALGAGRQARRFGLKPQRPRAASRPPGRGRRAEKTAPRKAGAGEAAPARTRRHGASVKPH